MVSVVLLACFASFALALNNGVGLTPPMGYNTWYDFMCNNINAANIMAVADKMVALGLNKVGYNYVNIDDCWAVGREPNGTLIPDPTAFPDGMKAVADYVHSKGLKFGIYTDRGNTTCAGRPGSGGYEQTDANTFASWGVDFVKEDSCNASSNEQTAFYEYGRMRDALNQTGREMYFSLCGWNPWYAPVGAGIANGWRISGDGANWPAIVNNIFVNMPLNVYSGPGAWNDPDMLIGSNPLAAVYVTQQQSRLQMSIWAVTAAPLLIGSNMLNMSDFDFETYTNTEVIAMNQDPLGIQGTVIWETCETYTPVPPCQQIWARPLADGSWGLVAVNYGPNDVVVYCDQRCFASIGMTSGSVRDVWAHEELGVYSNLNITIGADGSARAFRIYQA